MVSFSFSSTSCTHPPQYYYSHQCSYFQKYHNKFAWSITRKLHFQLSVKLLVAIIPPPEPTWGTKPSRAEPSREKKKKEKEGFVVCSKRASKGGEHIWFWSLEYLNRKSSSSRRRRRRRNVVTGSFKSHHVVRCIMFLQVENDGIPVGKLVGIKQ